jgi:hypothetical protein
MHFHGVLFGKQHESWSKPHNGKVSAALRALCVSVSASLCKASRGGGENPRNDYPELIKSWLFRIVISASRGADFMMMPRESALFSRGWKPTSLGVVPCQATAKASAPQAP